MLYLFVPRAAHSIVPAVLRLWMDLCADDDMLTAFAIGALVSADSEEFALTGLGLAIDEHQFVTQPYIDDVYVFTATPAGKAEAAAVELACVRGTPAPFFVRLPPHRRQPVIPSDAPVAPPIVPPTPPPPSAPALEDSKSGDEMSPMVGPLRVSGVDLRHRLSLRIMPLQQVLSDVKKRRVGPLATDTMNLLLQVLIAYDYHNRAEASSATSSSLAKLLPFTDHKSALRILGDPTQVSLLSRDFLLGMLALLRAVVGDRYKELYSLAAAEREPDQPVDPNELLQQFLARLSSPP